ncbi:alpha/beta fold hydrolase [Streptomyces massasporeus]|uniref:alpha/beta fold hydrolase n=1 Tax=Streptomyces massasporeus TaxID=67324 RepID=UPI003795FCD5
MPTAVHPPRTAAGPAHAHALVLAPVTPAWDEGAFFAPVIDTLTAAGAGLRVTVVDTLSLWDERVRTLDDLVARWRALLPAFGRIDLLCGNALGGAVAQGLLPYVAPGTAALLVSGPARSDATLEHRLTEIADLAAMGHTDASLALLHKRVQPDGTPASIGPDPTATVARTSAEGGAACRADGAAGDLGRLVSAGAAPAAPGDTPAARTGGAADGAGGDLPAGAGTAVGRAGGDRPVESHDGRAAVDGAVDGLGRLARADATPAAPGRLVRGGTDLAVPADIPPPAHQTPAQRLDGGLRLLCGIDLTAAVEAHPGPLLHLVGGRSQLVTRHHTAAGPHHRVHVVAAAGMRPHTDQPAKVSALIGAFLREKGLT